MGKHGNSDRLIFLGSKITVDSDCSHEIKGLLLQKINGKPRQHIKKQRHHFANKGFSSSHVWMWELDHKEDWVLKTWWSQTAEMEKTPESPLDCKEIKPINPKGNQPWIFFGRTDAEAEAPILWPPNAKSQLVGKDPDAAKNWRQEEKGVTEDEMVGWHPLLNGHEFEQAPGDSTGKPGVLQSMGLQRVGHNWVSEHQQQP